VVVLVNQNMFQPRQRPGDHEAFTAWSRPHQGKRAGPPLVPGVPRR